MWMDLSEGVGFMGSGRSDLWGQGIEVVGGWWEGLVPRNCEVN